MTYFFSIFYERLFEPLTNHLAFNLHSGFIFISLSCLPIFEVRRR